MPASASPLGSLLSSNVVLLNRIKWGGGETGLLCQGSGQGRAEAGRLDPDMWKVPWTPTWQTWVLGRCKVLAKLGLTAARLSPSAPTRSPPLLPDHNSHDQRSLLPEALSSFTFQLPGSLILSPSLAAAPQVPRAPILFLCQMLNGGAHSPHAVLSGALRTPWAGHISTLSAAGAAPLVRLQKTQIQLARRKASTCGGQVAKTAPSPLLYRPLQWGPVAPSI